MNVTTNRRLTEVNWEEPEFFEVTGDPLEITSNYDNPSELPWGTAVVVYTAINTDNGKIAICQFSVDVKREWTFGLDGILNLQLQHGGKTAFNCFTDSMRNNF